ncbi:hypothetical protein [Labrys wisconsinensis]|uniref:Antifreeze protein n=1 Tax=Labrys wisconsinensis TaxID=425677 RepID=A0ABU0JEM1_9HYPH|nr:hypothetical protein [Labrys wisconsinensis]MDQ0472719.1 hypothetical protein [Labrys wisconsinensis]
MSLLRSLTVAGTVLALGVASPAHATLALNALSINALSINALSINALTSNALTTDPRLASTPAIADLNGVVVEGVTLPRQNNR